MTDTGEWAPLVGEWVAVRRAFESKPTRHEQVTKRTPTQARVGSAGTVYRRRERHGYVEWVCTAGYPNTAIMPATRPQAELQAEWMTKLREDERRRLWREAEAHLLDAHKRGDDDAIRRAIHELEKGIKR